MSARVQWLGEVEWLGDVPGANCAKTCLDKFGTVFAPGYLQCVTECEAAKPPPTQAVPQSPWPSFETVPSVAPAGPTLEVPSQVPTFPTAPDMGCLAACESKYGISAGANWNAAELAKCVAGCAQTPAQPGGGASTPGGGGGGVTTCPAGQILVNGACVPAPQLTTPPGGGGAATTPAKAEEKTPWGWIVLGGLAAAGAAWALMRGAGEVGGAMAENPGALSRRYQVRFLPYIGSPYEEGRSGRVEKELPTLEQARDLMRRLKEPSSLIEDAELLEYTKAKWGGWGRRVIDKWDSPR